MIASPFLAGRDRYERATDAAVDNTHRDAFTHVVQVSDDDGAAKVRVVCTPSPEYGVREAEAWLTGRGGSCRAIAGFGELAGTRMVSGLRRRLVEMTGPGPDAALAVEAGLEVARLARQVARIPAAAVAHLGPEDARQYWQLDTTSWADLPDSCFTYSAAGRAVMETRPVTTSMTPQLYSSPPGTAGVFRRRRLARLVRTGPRLHLFNSLHDNVHGFDIHYEVDIDQGTIVAAHSITSRLPYHGVCSEPQARIASLVGQPVDAGLGKRTQALIGGPAGCAQLFDLTADLLRLLTL